MTDFTAQITYRDNEGDTVHSDLIPDGGEYCRLDAFKSEVYRKALHEALHEALDEWLNNSNGTGHFHIGAT